MRDLFVIKLKDGFLDGIQYDTMLESEGCPTCGFGQEYTTDLEFYFRNPKNKLTITSKDRTVDVGFLIMLFCNNFQLMGEMTEAECREFLVTEFQKKYPNKLYFM